MAFTVGPTCRIEQILIEKNKLPDTFGITYLHIVSSAEVSLPTCTLSFIDPIGFMEKIGIGDGTIVSITITTSVTKTYEFRVCKVPLRLQAGLGYTYTLEMYLNYPLYLAQTDENSQTGPSSAAMTYIANSVGLNGSQNNIVTTADSMVWSPGGRVYSVWARSIALRGYKSSTSLMVVAVSEDGDLLYKDISLAKIAVNVSTILTPGFVFCQEFKPTITPGVSNLTLNYDHTRYAQDLTPIAYDSIDVFPHNNSILLSSTVDSIITNGGCSFGPVLFGTTHENYDNAVAQNVRADATYSVQGEFLFPTSSGLSLLDAFTFELKTQALDSQQNNSELKIDFSGKWIVKTKMIHIEGPHFAEKIIAVKQTLSN